MHNGPFNDEVLLDRLVDGELTGDERRRLLKSLDERPGGWRRCALAFLEAQTWREEFGQLAHASRPTAKNDLPASPVRFGGRLHRISSVQWLAVAAGLFLAFGLGWALNRPLTLTPLGGPLYVKNDNAPHGLPPATSQSPNVGQVSDALTFYGRDDSGRMQSVRVPLVDAGTLDGQLGVKFQPGLSDAMRDQLKNRGYDVQSKHKYAQLWLENGQPMIVPVEDTKIVPVVY
jgi:hypothetical protein